MRRFLVLLSAVIMSFLMPSAVHAAGIDVVAPTNLDGACFSPYDNGDPGDGKITLGGVGGVGGKIADIVGKKYVALFVNGSVVPQSSVVIERDRALMPAETFAKLFELTVSYNGKSGEVTLSDGVVSATFGSGKAMLLSSGKEVVAYVAAKLVDGVMYIPVRNAAETFGVSVDYFDGKGEPDEEGLSRYHKGYIAGIPHIMLWKYPDGIKPMTTEAAAEKFRERTIIAYENTFGKKFEPWAEPPDSKQGKFDDDEQYDRYAITAAKVVRENDRFVCIQFGFEFMVDKYTGEVYRYYNGQNQTINRFDPYSAGALMFAG